MKKVIVLTAILMIVAMLISATAFASINDWRVRLWISGETSNGFAIAGVSTVGNPAPKDSLDGADYPCPSINDPVAYLYQIHSDRSIQATWYTDIRAPFTNGIKISNSWFIKTSGVGSKILTLNWDNGGQDFPEGLPAGGDYKVYVKWAPGVLDPNNLDEDFNPLPFAQNPTIIDPAAGPGSLQFQTADNGLQASIIYVFKQGNTADLIQYPNFTTSVSSAVPVGTAPIVDGNYAFFGADDRNIYKVDTTTGNAALLPYSASSVQFPYPSGLLVTAAASSGASQVIVSQLTGLATGMNIDFKDTLGKDVLSTNKITAINTTTKTLTLSPALAADLPLNATISIAGGAVNGVKGRMGLYNGILYGVTDAGGVFRRRADGTTTGSSIRYVDANVGTTPAFASNSNLYVGCGNVLKRLDSAMVVNSTTSPNLGGPVGSPCIPGTDQIWVNAGTHIVRVSNDLSTVLADTDMGATVGTPAAFTWFEKVIIPVGNKLVALPITSMNPDASFAYEAGSPITSSVFWNIDGKAYFVTQDRNLHTVTTSSMTAAHSPVFLPNTAGTGTPIAGSPVVAGTTIAISGGSDCETYLIDKNDYSVSIIGANQATLGAVTNGTDIFFADTSGTLFQVR